MPELARNVDALAGKEFDVLVVGGGINGTGVAREAALRGLSVALVEREDYGYGTTGRSTRLIHGGLRYLEMYDFGLVRESLRERERLLANAPHLVRPLRFLFPVYEGGPNRFKVRLGMILYDLLSFDRSVPGHAWLSREETLAEEPALNPEGLLGAFEYHDSQVAAVERLCVENAIDAERHGAALANHVEVVEFRVRDGAVVGALCRDRLTGKELEIASRVTFNATGPWLAMLDVPRASNGHGEGGGRLRMTKGIHLFVPRATRNALTLRAPGDNRTFFAIPWLDGTMVGTTDTDYAGDLDDLVATKEDVEYLLRAAREHLPGAPLDEIRYTYAGVRSLIKIEGVSESKVSRKHFVLDHAKVDGIDGVVTLVGGKITPFRGVAEEVTDVLARKLGQKRERATREAPLPGGSFEDLEALRARAVEDAKSIGVGSESARHLADLYGARYPNVLALAAKDARLARPLCAHGPDLAAEVAHAVEEESARTVADALLRRTLAGWRSCEALDGALDATLDVMAPRLRWSASDRARERAAYEAEVAKRRRFRA